MRREGPSVPLRAVVVVASALVLASLVSSSGRSKSAVVVHRISGSTPVASYSASFGFNGHAGLYAYGMGFDTTDNTVLVGDLWNYRVQRFDLAGNFIKTVSHVAQRGALGGIGAPFGVTADPTGNVWVADQPNSRVVEFSHNGAWMQTIGEGGGPNPFENHPRGCGGGAMTSPTHVVIDPSNAEVYVVDDACSNVYVFNSTGTFQRQFTWTIGASAIPRGIGMDTSHNLYVAEFTTKLVYVFDTSGHQLRVFSAPTNPADMSDPRGLAVDNANHRVYVIGAQNNKVVVFDTNGSYLATWSSAGAAAFNSIRFVTTDSSSNVYVSDLYGYVVYKFDPSGNILPWATSRQPPPNGGWNQLNGVAVDPATGNVFGVDTFGNRVQRFGTSNGQSCISAVTCGSFQLTFGQRGPTAPNSPSLDYPHEIAVGSDSDVWVDGTNVLLHFDLDGNYLGSVGSHGPGLGQFVNGPQGIQVAPFGAVTSAIYTVDESNCVQIFDYAGNLLAYMGSCGSGTDQMLQPRQLTVDRRNSHVYVADTANSRVAEWDATTGHIIATFNGPIDGFSLNQPRGVALDPACVWLYIGDSLNNRIVRVGADLDSTTGVLVTAGADTPAGSFGGPEFMTFSGFDGRLFVSDNNQTIYAFSVVAGPPPPGQPPRSSSGGYRQVASDGGIFTFGNAAFLGSTGSMHLNRPIVGMAPTPTGHGYWLVASDGGIFTFGDAGFLGSTGALHLNQPIVGMAPTPTGRGYWLVASDGGIFTFGDAGFLGSTGAIHLNQPIVGMAPTPTGRGDWLVASDGGIFTFGDAGFLGSTGAIHLNQPIVGMAPTPTGRGYWLVASDGGIFTFGDAGFLGSTGAIHLNQPIVGMAPTPTGRGYWLVASDGGIFTFGDAGFLGSTGAIHLNQPIVAVARDT